MDPHLYVLLNSNIIMSISVLFLISPRKVINKLKLPNIIVNSSSYSDMATWLATGFYIYYKVCIISVQSLRNLIFGLCDPCGIPQTALSSGDPSCANYIFRRNITAICMGRCRSIIDDIIDNCPNTVSVISSIKEAIHI